MLKVYLTSTITRGTWLHHEKCVIMKYVRWSLMGTPDISHQTPKNYKLTAILKKLRNMFTFAQQHWSVKIVQNIKNLIKKKNTSPRLCWDVIMNETNLEDGVCYFKRRLTSSLVYDHFEGRAWLALCPIKYIKISSQIVSEARQLKLQSMQFTCEFNFYHLQQFKETTISVSSFHLLTSGS